MSKIEIDTRQLNSDINELKTNIDTARKSLESVKAEMDELNNMWQGAANRAFSRQVTDDYNTMKELLSAMDNLSESMAHAKSEYKNCEDAVKGNIDSIRI